MRLWMLSAPKPQKSYPSNIYQHANELPLIKFIDCLVNKNFKCLVKTGTATQKEILSAWDNIYSEYCDLSGSPQYKSLMLLNREIGFLRSKILTIKLCLGVLILRPSQSAITQLRAYGYAYPFNYEDKVSYFKDLSTVGNKSKSHELALELKIKDLEKMNMKSEPVTEQTFTGILVTLSNHYHRNISAREITVSEFATIRKAYDDEIEALRIETAKLKK